MLSGEAWKPAGGGDLVSFLFPTYRFAAARLSAGNLPLWNPHLYGGAPFLADMQSGLFYPPNLLLFLLAPNFSYAVMQWLAAGHVFLAGVTMYLCLRYLAPGHGLRRPAALVGALAYMFSGIFVVHFGNLNLIAVAAWLPLVFLLFWRAVVGRSPGLAAGAGVALGLSTLVGHLQITLMVGLALGLAAVVAVVQGWPRRRRPTEDRSWWDRRRLARVRGTAWPLLALIVTAAVALGLAALVLLPALEYARLSPRAVLPYRQAARYSLVPALLGELLVPALFSSREPALYWGVWDRVAAGYVGLLPLILAGLALLLRRGRRIALLAALGVTAFLLALGSESVFHGWAYLLLPGFGQIRAPARFVLLLDFALAGLAALGLDRLLQPLDRRSRRTFDGAWRGLLWLGGAAAVVGGAWAYLVVYQAQDRDPTLFWRVSAATNGVILALGLLAAALAWLGARRSGRLRRRALAWLAVGLVFVDLASLGAYVDLGFEPPTAGYEHPGVVGFLRQDPDFYRIDSRTDVADVWQPDLALLAGLYDVGGVDNPLMVADVERYWQGLGGRSTALYDFLGVKYVIAGKDTVLDWEKFSLAYDGDPAVNVYRNERALSRARVVFQVLPAADPAAAWDLIHLPDFDPASTVVLEGVGPAADEGQVLGELPAAPGGARVVGYGSDSLEIEVESPAAGYLVLSDPYYPGWMAALDGHPVEILRANYAFRAVPVPAGTHRVTMAFRPATWRGGLAITAGTVLVLLVWAVLAWRRRSQRMADE
ncbi:MAG: YfhO family protein [Anaerolineae bacterium]